MLLLLLLLSATDATAAAVAAAAVTAVAAAGQGQGLLQTTTGKGTKAQLEHARVFDTRQLAARRSETNAWINITKWKYARCRGPRGGGAAVCNR